MSVRPDRKARTPIVPHPPSKKCPRCKKIKPRTEYHKDRGNKDGLHGHCKICKNKINRFNANKVDTRIIQRLPASAFDYNCNTCGMGYHTQLAADLCCKKAREMKHGDGSGFTKYGSYAGEQEWKYTREYRWGRK